MEHRDESDGIGRWIDDRLETLSSDDAWRPDVPTALARLELARGTSASRQRRWTWGTAGAVAFGLSLLLFPSTQILAQRCVAACVEQTGRVGRILWGPSARAVGTATPLIASPERRMAPALSAFDQSGRAVSLAAYRGSVVLLNFWATWCRPCEVEIPWFGELQQRYADRGLVVVGVSMDDDGWAPVRGFLTKHRMTYPVILASDDVRRGYADVIALPTTLILDRTGRIASKRVGLAEKADYEGDIRAVLAE